MLNIHNSGVDMSYSQLCIVGDSDLAGIYEYLTLSGGAYCKNDSFVTVISGKPGIRNGLLLYALSCDIFFSLQFTSTFN